MPTVAEQRPVWPDRATDAIASSTLRSLIVLGHANTNTPRTAAEQAYDLQALQYPGATVEPNHKLQSDITQACVRVLGPAGILEAVPVRNRMNREATAWRLTQEGHRSGVPAAAAYADWTINYMGCPDMEDLLGVFRAGQAIGRPLMSLEVFGCLVDKPSGMSWTEIVESTGFDESAVYAVLKSLRSKSLLQHAAKTDPVQRQLKLVAPSNQPAHRFTAPEARAVRNTAEGLYRTRREEVNALEFLEIVMANNPGFDRDTVWKTMTQGALSCINFADINDYGPTRNHRTRYEIPPGYQEGVSDLVGRHRALRSDLDFVSAARQRARQILGKSELVGYLLNKGASIEDDPNAANRAVVAYWTARRLGPLATKSLIDWRELAACQGEDTELFFPVGTLGPSAEQIKDAKSVCADCPVRQECLDWALASGQADGIFGGLTEAERRKVRRPTTLMGIKTNREITTGVQERVELIAG